MYHAPGVIPGLPLYRWGLPFNEVATNSASLSGSPGPALAHRSVGIACQTRISSPESEHLQDKYLQVSSSSCAANYIKLTPLATLHLYGIVTIGKLRAMLASQRYLQQVSHPRVRVLSCGRWSSTLAPAIPVIYLDSSVVVINKPHGFKSQYYKQVLSMGFEARTHPDDCRTKTTPPCERW